MLSEFPFLYRFTVLSNSGGSNSPWSEFWSEFPHFMGMGVVPAPSKIGVFQAGLNISREIVFVKIRALRVNLASFCQLSMENIGKGCSFFWLTVGSFLLIVVQLELFGLQLKLFCLQWERASNKHLNQL